ncbi:Uncharacterised protein [Burkholderia pseudomallei]|nr:hypothetical protein BG24_2939 [Burkholderia pseudomallei PB08298010]CAJ5224202.1 Uncharacterised protein [Burkholderia pseudomallei]CAJ8948181.1 Uncharacterised protein [Burkholderia pseudomallei]
MFEPPPPRRACRVPAYRVRMQGADQWRRNRRAARRRGRAARKRQESGRKAARNGATFYAPVGKSSAPRRARHVVYGGMRAPDIGIQAAIRSAPHARTERARTARQAAASRSHGGKPRTRRGKREKARAAAPASRLECGKRRAARATRRGETPHGGRRSATERNDRNRNAAPTAAPECSIRAPPPAARRTRRARAPRSDSDRIRRARAPRRSRSGCAPTGTSRCRRSYRRRP